MQRDNAIARGSVAVDYWYFCCSVLTGASRREIIKARLKLESLAEVTPSPTQELMDSFKESQKVLGRKGPLEVIYSNPPPASRDTTN